MKRFTHSHRNPWPGSPQRDELPLLQVERSILQATRYVSVECEPLTAELGSVSRNMRCSFPAPHAVSHSSSLCPGDTRTSAKGYMAGFSMISDGELPVSEVRRPLSWRKGRTVPSRSSVCWLFDPGQPSHRKVALSHPGSVEYQISSGLQ